MESCHRNIKGYLLVLIFATLTTPSSYAISGLMGESYTPKPRAEHVLGDLPRQSTPKPHFCNYVLSRLIETDDLTKLHEISDLLNDSDKMRINHYAAFNDLSTLGLLFSKGIIFEALGEELRARKHTSTIEMEMALNLLHSGKSAEDKIRFIDSVVNRTLAKIGSLKFSMNETKSIRLRAPKLNLTPTELAELLPVLATQTADDYVLIKLALYQELFHGGRNLKPYFEAETGHFKDLAQFFTRSQKPHERRNSDGHDEAEKIVSLKLAYLHRLSESKNASFDVELTGFFGELKNTYLDWLWPTYVADKLEEFFSLLNQVQSDEEFSRILKEIVVLSYDVGRSDIILEALLLKIKGQSSTNASRTELLGSVLGNVKAHREKSGRGRFIFSDNLIFRNHRYKPKVVRSPDILD